MDRFSRFPRVSGSLPSWDITSSKTCSLRFYRERFAVTTAAGAARLPECCTHFATRRVRDRIGESTRVPAPPPSRPALSPSPRHARRPALPCRRLPHPLHHPAPPLPAPPPRLSHPRYDPP